MIPQYSRFRCVPAASQRGNALFPIALLIALAVIAYLVYGWLRTPPTTEPSVVGEPVETVAEPAVPVITGPLPEPPREVVEEYQLAGELPALEQSDAYLRGHLMFLAGEPLLNLLQGDQLIRRIVAQVDGVAKNSIAYQHSPIAPPAGGGLAVIETEDGVFLDPASYRRYDFHADVLSRLATDLLLAFYRFYEPLFDAAHEELGNPAGTFRRRFVEALDRVLAAPVVDAPIELVREDPNWKFADPELEALGQVEKQMLRMGPENTRKIQQALASVRARLVD